MRETLHLASAASPVEEHPRRFSRGRGGFFYCGVSERQTTWAGALCLLLLHRNPHGVPALSPGADDPHRLLLLLLGLTPNLSRERRSEFVAKESEEVGAQSKRADSFFFVPFQTS